MSDKSLPTIIVPSRLASTRFPRKLLAKVGGKPLIQLTAERLRHQVPEFELFFAVDGPELEKLLSGLGYACIRTDPDLPSGTDRIAQANTGLKREKVLNVQADEPLVLRSHVIALTKALEKKGADLATLATPFSTDEEFHQPNQVKVVLDASGYAMYFSRSPIPFSRDLSGRMCHRSLKHLGMYGYRKAFLKSFSSLPPGHLEEIEKLEQLRALENGKRISVEVVNEGSIGIDCEKDLAVLEHFLKHD